MPFYKTDGVVLRSYNLKEADKIIVLFSPLHGKIDAVARGIRKPASKFGGSLEVFSHVYLMLAEGMNLDVISQVEVTNPHYSLREDLKRLTFASYFIELIDKSVQPGQENLDLFALVLTGLSLLEYYDNLELVLSYLELNFLDALGLRPVLNKCQSCGRKIDFSPVKFLISSGGAICRSCENKLEISHFSVSIETLNFISGLYRLTPERLKDITCSHMVLKESKILMRRLILHHVNREIKSIKMLDSY